MPRFFKTDLQVKNMKPQDVRFEAVYHSERALRLVVQPTGNKSWAVRYRRPGGGKPAKITLGGYPALTLEEAADAARKAVRDVARKSDPGREKRKAKAAAGKNTVEAVFADWIRLVQSKKKSEAEVKRIFARDILPHWGDRQIASITDADCEDILDAIVKRGAETMARRTFAHLHSFFRWCIKKKKRTDNPLVSVDKPGKDIKRERKLADPELARVWHAASATPYPFGPALQLLILTAARREEIGALRWSEVDLDDSAIYLAGERTKNGEPRTIALSDAARDILAGLPRIDVNQGDDAFVFSTRGGKPISGWSRAKKLLDAKIALTAADGSEMDEHAQLEPWRLHDFRRTAAVGLQKLGVRLEVTEAVLGHISGSRAGVVGIYQTHKFETEAATAIAAWSRRIEQIVAGTGEVDGKANVVALAEARQ